MWPWKCNVMCCLVSTLSLSGLRRQLWDQAQQQPVLHRLLSLLGQPRPSAWSPALCPPHPGGGGWGRWHGCVGGEEGLRSECALVWAAGLVRRAIWDGQRPSLPGIHHPAGACSAWPTLQWEEGERRQSGGGGKTSHTWPVQWDTEAQSALHSILNIWQLQRYECDRSGASTLLYLFCTFFVYYFSLPLQQQILKFNIIILHHKKVTKCKCNCTIAHYSAMQCSSIHYGITENIMIPYNRGMYCAWAFTSRERIIKLGSIKSKILC